MVQISHGNCYGFLKLLLVQRVQSTEMVYDLNTLTLSFQVEQPELHCSTLPYGFLIIASNMVCRMCLIPSLEMLQASAVR